LIEASVLDRVLLVAHHVEGEAVVVGRPFVKSSYCRSSSPTPSIRVGGRAAEDQALLEERPAARVAVRAFQIFSSSDQYSEPAFVAPQHRAHDAGRDHALVDARDLDHAAVDVHVVADGVRTASFCQPAASSVRLICVPIGPGRRGREPVFGLSVSVHPSAAG
jgi:hypothetical protein